MGKKRVDDDNNDLSMFYQAETKTLIGQRRVHLVNTDTGEEIEVDQIVKRAYGQKKFWKLYLVDFLEILGVLESRQIDVLIYILERTHPSTNLFIGTWTSIEQGTGVSRGTISKVFGKLVEHDFLVKVQNGVWQVSPRIMMRGGDYQRKLLIEYYDDAQRTNAQRTTDNNAAD